MILLSINASYNQLYALLALHIDVDLTCKSIQIEYQLTDIECKIRIRNDMGLKVYIMQKRKIKAMSALPLYISVSEKDSVDTFLSSSICNTESMNLSITARNVVNTSTERALIVTTSDECLDAFEMDTTKVIISNPHHKHIEVEQFYISKGC